MDGIAIKYDKSIKNWELIGEISAGNYRDIEINKSQCFRIMTGGKIPQSADTIIPIEHLIESGNIISLNPDNAIKSRQHIRLKGSDIYEGMLALSKNSSIRLQNISMLAACGKSKVKVYQKFKIGIMVTGDELVEVSKKPINDEIRATNYYTILASIESMGHVAIPLGLIKDDINMTEQSVINALKSDIDILITTGGVSVGKYDFLKDIFSEQGIVEEFWRVNIKPGKPIYFGSYQNGNSNKLIIGLPGNPVSTFVTFILFVANNINKYYSNNEYEIVVAELDSDLNKKDKKRHFSRGIIRYDLEDGKYKVTDAGSSSSGNMATLSNSNCLIMIEENEINPKKGEVIKCIMI